MNANTPEAVASNVELGLDIDWLIELASDCNLGRRMTPLCYNSGEVFGTDASYRTSELIEFSERLIAAERERLCAAIKAADDKAADNDYMLDSNDCISVILGTWNPDA